MINIMFTLIVIDGDIMKFYLCVVTLLLQGCQQPLEQSKAKNDDEKFVKNKVICQQSTIPLLKNSQKLKKMLIARGYIDGSLSKEAIEQAVKTYIRKKNSAFRNCKK